MATVSFQRDVVVRDSKVAAQLLRELESDKRACKDSAAKKKFNAKEKETVDLWLSNSKNFCKK